MTSEYLIVNAEYPRRTAGARKNINNTEEDTERLRSSFDIYFAAIT